MGAEILTRALFQSGQAHTVIAVELPRSRAMMHPDTAMTMIDRGAFVLYPHLGRHLRSWTVTPGDQPGGRQSVARNRSLWGTLAGLLGVDEVTVLTTD